MARLVFDVSKMTIVAALSLASLALSLAPALAQPVGERRETVIIGDSLTCGSFGKGLFSDLRSEGTAISLYCAPSSVPNHWMKGLTPKGQKCQTVTSLGLTGESTNLTPCEGTGQVPPLKKILERHRGARFIVALGTNSLMLYEGNPAYKEMADLVSKNGTCLWVGPPHMQYEKSKGFPMGWVSALDNRLPSFYLSLKQYVEPSCRLIDSRPATAKGASGHETVDGVHRTADSGLAWADQVAGEIEPPAVIEPSTPASPPKAAQ